MEINLGQYKNKRNIKVFSGRDNGKSTRQRLELDKNDKNKETIKIIIPEDIYSLNSSYFLGLFGQSIRLLGEQTFREKYIFECDDVIRKNIEDGISRALKESDVLKGC